MIKLNELDYEVIDNDNTNLDLEEITKLATDYFIPYDYIIGDYAYGKLRLKGFCDKSNKLFNKINDIANKEKYIKEDCAYGCTYFVLKKVQK